MPVCPNSNCDHANTEKAVYCARCGRPMQHAVEANESGSALSALLKTVSALLLLFGLCLLFALLAGTR